MEVILLEKISNLGRIGDQVKVSNGYARNFLLPQQLAVMATPANVAEFESRRVELEKQSADRLVAAEARAKEIGALENVRIVTRASEEGRLYGSIGVREITDAVTAAGVDIKKQEVLLPNGPIRSVGAHEVHLQLHSDVHVILEIVVEAEKAS